MMTLAQFRVRYPEFGTADDSLVQAMLDDAAIRLNADAFGAKADIAHGLMAAHILLNKPYGRSQRLESGSTEDDRYMQELDRLKVECISAILVL